MGVYTIKGGKIWNDTCFVPNTEYTYEVAEERDQVITLSDEDMIVPGLIDMHTHLWAPPAKSSFGVAMEKYWSTGVAGAVDAGTYGVTDWEAANRYWKSANILKVKSYVSILPEGLTIFPPVTPTKPEGVDVQQYVDVISRNKEDALGVKVQLGWLNYKNVETDTKLLELCREIADKTGTTTMVHISGQCMAAEDSANMLKARDILTHPYSGFSNTILDENGKVRNALFDAKDRGVLFDCGYAGKHFSWKVFEKAYGEGLMFDTLGTDMATMTYRVPNSIVVDHFHILSGFLNFGVPADDVFRALLTNPADYLGWHRPRLAHTSVVLKQVVGDTVSTDGQGDSIPLKFEYVPTMVLRNGYVVYENNNK